MDIKLAASNALKLQQKLHRQRILFSFYPNVRLRNRCQCT